MYKRIILKISGEALSNETENFDDNIVTGLVNQIKEIVENGTEVCLVIGGGNFWRGRSADSKMDRTKADQIGMLARRRMPMLGFVKVPCILIESMVGGFRDPTVFLYFV